MSAPTTSAGAMRMRDAAAAVSHRAASVSTTIPREDSSQIAMASSAMGTAAASSREGLLALANHARIPTPSVAAYSAAEEDRPNALIAPPTFSAAYPLVVAQEESQLGIPSNV